MFIKTFYVFIKTIYPFISILLRAPFRQGLVQGEKQVIYPILQWLFERLPDLRKRAYLARFLVRMEIPGDLLGDQELYDLNESVSTP